MSVSLLDELLFDTLIPAEVPVKIRNKDGTVQSFVLREASAEAARQFRNCATRAAKMQDGRVTGVDGLADAEILLVSHCLFRQNVKADGTPQDVPVSQGELRTWPSKVVSRLFERAKEISELSEDEPTVKALAVGLSREDAPVKLAVLRAWAEQLPDEELLRPLKKLLKPTQEEILKNALGSGMASSASPNGAAEHSQS